MTPGAGALRQTGSLPVPPPCGEIVAPAPATDPETAFLGCPNPGCGGAYLSAERCEAPGVQRARLRYACGHSAWLVGADDAAGSGRDVRMNRYEQDPRACLLCGLDIAAPKASQKRHGPCQASVDRARQREYSKKYETTGGRPRRA